VLQKRAKPVIERLLDDPKGNVDIGDCKTLALWAVMTAMVLEALNDPKTWRFSEEDRGRISHGRDQIPEFTHVWIGRWVDSPGPSYICHLLSRDGAPAVGAVSTFGFGTLAFQILKVNPIGMPSGPMACRPGPWNDILLDVSSPKSNASCWPLPTGIQGDPGIEALELRFSPPGASSA